jgi:hypothetical protein
LQAQYWELIDELLKEGLFLELRKKHLAVGRPVCGDSGVYFPNTKELVCNERTG